MVVRSLGSLIQDENVTHVCIYIVEEVLGGGEVEARAKGV